jgi:hypothetical protein
MQSDMLLELCITIGISVEFNMYNVYLPYFMLHRRVVLFLISVSVYACMLPHEILCL